MPPGALSRDELVELVARILRGDCDDAEQDRLVALFDDSVTHPGATDLIYWPERVLGPETGGRRLSPEEIVDLALAHRPIELGRPD